MSEAYKEYLRSDCWKSKRLRKLREGVWSRGHCLCERCFCLVHQSAIEVHPLSYDRLGEELLSDLKIVCAGCHASIHGHHVPDWWLGLASVEHRRAGFMRAVEHGMLSAPTATDAIDEALWESIPVIGAKEIHEDRSVRHISHI